MNNALFRRSAESIIPYIVQPRIGSMLISNGSGKGGFQRTYKNNGSGTGAKLKSLYYCGNPSFFSQKAARDCRCQGGGRGKGRVLSYRFDSGQLTVDS